MIKLTTNIDGYGKYLPKIDNYNIAVGDYVEFPAEYQGIFVRANLPTQLQVRRRVWSVGRGTGMDMGNVTSLTVELHFDATDLKLYTATDGSNIYERCSRL